MANELMSLLDYIEQEKGMSRDKLLTALEKALVAAGKKTIPCKDIEVQVDKTNGDIKAWILRDVVEKATKDTEICLKDAQKVDAEAVIGTVLREKIPQDKFGRIAAQSAKQTIFQELRRAEKERVREEFADSIGKIVNGTVKRFESGNVIIDFQKAEGILTAKEKIHGDNFNQGDRVNALLVDIDTEGSGPSLYLSRSRADFLRRLFESEVSEIADGVVEIMAIARDKKDLGPKSKVAVRSNDTKVDPIGACVGRAGSRVKNITTELGGERIDIVRYDDDISVFITNAMQPMTPVKVTFDAESGELDIYLDKSRLEKPHDSRYTDRGGGMSRSLDRMIQNLKLAAKLVAAANHPNDVIRIRTDNRDPTRVRQVAAFAGKDIGPGASPESRDEDIVLTLNLHWVESEEKAFERKMEDAATSLAGKLGVSSAVAEKLVAAGYSSVEVLSSADDARDAMLAAGLSESEADEKLRSIKDNKE